MSGIVRRVDDLGRIVIPKAIRDRFGIKERDALTVSLDGDRIVLQRPEGSCKVCGSQEDVLTIGGRRICKACIPTVKKT